MEDVEKLITKAITTIILAVILTIGSCSMHGDYRISKAIEAGVDPILARNAFENGVGSNASIERIIYLSNKKD